MLRQRSSVQWQEDLIKTVRKLFTTVSSGVFSLKEIQICLNQMKE